MDSKVERYYKFIVDDLIKDITLKDEGVDDDGKVIRLIKFPWPVNAEKLYNWFPEESRYPNTPDQRWFKSLYKIHFMNWWFRDFVNDKYGADKNDNEEMEILWEMFIDELYHHLYM